MLLTRGGDALISWSWEWYERFSVHPPRVLFQDTEPYVFGRLLSHQPTQKNPMTLMENKTASNVAGFFFVNGGVCSWENTLHYKRIQNGNVPWPYLITGGYPLGLSKSVDV